jgi:heme-degrading monooxygenase HmoA
MTTTRTLCTGLTSAIGTGAYAVIFSSMRTAGDQGYGQTSDEMVALAREQPGFLGMETARGPDGVGITVSYWKDLESIRRWKAHGDHLAAQRAGRERWYRAYRVRVCRVEREYAFDRE